MSRNVVLDVAPRAEADHRMAAEQADLILIPCRPSIFDFRALQVTHQLAAVKIVNRRMAYLVQDSSLAALSKWDNNLPDQIDGEMRVPMAIEREVAILKLIEHPNIMKIYDIWENRSEV